MIYLLDADDPESPFPAPALAETDPNGLLAVGGDLSPTRLLNAYRLGIFPWFSRGQPILWWAPDPRMVLYPNELKVSRSLRKTLRRGHLSVSFDQDFGAVIRACAMPRTGDDGTWLLPPMIRAYEALHRVGHAHSVESWEGDRLVGGLYGVALGRIFFGESMFSRVTDASKAALVALVERLRRHDFRLLDCQVHTTHLESLGARAVPRAVFQQAVDAGVAAPNLANWAAPPSDTRDLDAAGIRS
jgi:leucyl/phenylalanyl-tRNA--protein transferase